MGEFRPQFDHDMKVGEIYEAELKDILACKIEVKTEVGPWRSTGNAFIEYARKLHRFTDETEPTGISVTESPFWAHILTMPRGGVYRIILIPTTVLKMMFDKYYDAGQFTLGGDDNRTWGVLIPLREILLWRDYDPAVTGIE